MKLTAGKTASLALQHVLAMYAGAMIVPLIVGSSLGLSSSQLTYLVSIDIFMCGIATLMQILSNRFFGIGLPIVLGCTFTAVGPMIAIGSSYGIGSVYGAVIVSGCFVLLAAGVFGKIAKFFPPVVTGSVVTIIGITLIPVAMGNMAGGEGSKDFGSLENVSIAFGVLLLIILLFRFTKGFVRSISILIGIAAGTAVCAAMGMTDFKAVEEASWVSGVKPFYFGVPVFEWAPIITMILVAIVSMIESTGVYLAVADLCGRKIDEKDLARGYRAEGLAYLLGGVLNAFPYTAYSQNVGLIQLSGVKKRKVIAAAGVMLALLGLVPKIAAFTTVIPSPVLGGAMIAMFGMVIAYGIKMLSRVDFSSQENLLIIACSIGIGTGVTAVPDMFANMPEALKILTSNGIVAGSTAAIMLNLLLHARSGKRRAEREQLEFRAVKAKAQ